MCKAVPYHAKLTLSEYGLGLGVNCMEGREQKHQAIAKYLNNTTAQNRWPLIFRHEYIQLIHLRENGFDEKNYSKRAKSYIPTSENYSCAICYHVRSDIENCYFCENPIIKNILLRIEQ